LKKRAQAGVATQFMICRPALRLALTILATGLSGICFSQMDAGSGWICFTRTGVKPEMRPRFEAYVKQIMAAYRKAGIPWFLTVQNVAGDTTEYTTVVPIMKFGDLDGPEVPVKVLGEEEWGRLSRKVDRCYSTQSRQYAARLSELEIKKEDVPMGIYWLETRTQVAQGRMEDYLTWLKNDYLPALQKAGVSRFFVSRPIFGGEGSEVVSSRMLRNLAEIDGGPVLTKALGEDGARAANARLVPLVRSSTTRIVLVRTDLTYSTASPPAN
jgi:hypothetical protein